jgi:hypothetical protein
MRLIVLGASNASNLLPDLMVTARHQWGSGVELVAACGFGRSYGRDSHFMLRRLPAIRHCGVWEYLERCRHSPQHAVITDVGNDLLYGASPAETVGWVEQCLARLRPVCGRVLVTGPPRESLMAVPAWRFHLLRRCFWPPSRLGFQQSRQYIQQLHDGLHELARRYDCRWLVPSPAWYHWDPVHITRLQRRAACMAMLSELADADAPPIGATAKMSVGRPQRREAIWIRTRRAAQRAIAGYALTTPQPCARLRDGSQLALF